MGDLGWTFRVVQPSSSHCLLAGERVPFNGTDITELYDPSDEDMGGEDETKDNEDQDEDKDDPGASSTSTSQRKKWFDVAKATTSALRSWTVRYNNIIGMYEGYVTNLETLLAKTGGTEVCV